MPNPLVTVITPTHNCGKFIEQTIKSVSVQDYPNKEHIVFDDGSTDDTWKLLEKYCDEVACVRNRLNKGEQATVNEGLRMVKGKYFIILNGDDYLLPGAITKLVDFMEANPDVLCAYPNWDMVDEQGNLKMHMTPRDYDFAYLVSHHTWMMSVGSIFRSDVIKTVGYRDESFKWLGDADYWLRIGLVGKMARVPETLACWRYRNGQASGMRSRERAREHVRLMEKFYRKTIPVDVFPPPVSIIEARDRILNYPINLYALSGKALCWANLVASTITDSKKETISYVYQAFKSYPQIIFSLEFWHTVVKRALFVLRRRA